MPVVKFLRRRSSSLSHERSLEASDDIDLHAMMSKTIQFDDLLNDDENYMNQKKPTIHGDGTDNYEIHFTNPNSMKGLEKLNEVYIKPLLTRKSSLKETDEPSVKHHDRKPLLSASNGTRASLMDDIDDEDEDGEDELLVVNQYRQENFQLKTINQKTKDSIRINLASENT